MYKILVCDDEKDIVSALEIYLKAAGYAVICTCNGQEALEVLQKEEIHLVLLDIMMPVMDGMETLKNIRETSNVPVIFLTAKGEDLDLIQGLTLGADDYITKPFRPMELQARVYSQIRRYTLLGGKTDREEDDPEILRIGSIELDDAAKEVTSDGKPVSLTPTEYDILKLLMQNPGKVFSPREIYRQVWNSPAFDGEGTVSVHIRHLREKLEIDPSAPRYLKVVWGRGYKIEH